MTPEVFVASNESVGKAGMPCSTEDPLNWDGRAEMEEDEGCEDRTTN
jgi:hypothetical protein